MLSLLRPVLRPLATRVLPRMPAAALLHPPSRFVHTPVQKVEDVVAYRTAYTKPEPAAVQPLKEAPALYARIHIHNWDMMVTPGDIIKLPVRMRDVEVGSTLTFSECSEIGSRNHTLSGGLNGKGRIDPSLFRIKGVCLEKTRVKRAVKETTRRRRRHVKHVVSNNCLTVIRVSEVSLA